MTPARERNFINPQYQYVTLTHLSAFLCPLIGRPTGSTIGCSLADMVEGAVDAYLMSPPSRLPGGAEWWQVVERLRLEQRNAHLFCASTRPVRPIQLEWGLVLVPQTLQIHFIATSTTMLRFTAALLPFVVTILQSNLGLASADVHEVEMNSTAARNLRGVRNNKQEKGELCFNLQKRKLGDFGMQVRDARRIQVPNQPSPTFLSQTNRTSDRQGAIGECTVVLERSRCD